MELKRCFFASVEKKLVSACRFLLFAIFCVKKIAAGRKLAFVRHLCNITKRDYVSYFIYCS